MKASTHYRLLAVFFSALLLGMLVLVVGTIHRAGYSAARDALPSCEEDETLYPVDAEGRLSFEGPGEAAPSDYGCVHIDTFG